MQVDTLGRFIPKQKIRAITSTSREAEQMGRYGFAGNARGLVAHGHLDRPGDVDRGSVSLAVVALH